MSYGWKAKSLFDWQWLNKTKDLNLFSIFDGGREVEAHTLRVFWELRLNSRLKRKNTWQMLMEVHTCRVLTRTYRVQLWKGKQWTFFYEKSERINYGVKHTYHTIEKSLKHWKNSTAIVPLDAVKQVECNLNVSPV